MPSPLAYLGASPATTTDEGVVKLATTAETITGTNTTKACTPAGVAAVAIAGAPDASTSQKGIIEIATNGEASAKTSGLLAVVPSNIPGIMADPGDIGGTTAAAGTFTTLTATTLVFSSALDVSEGGTGLTTITDHGIMLGSGTGAVTPLGVGTTGQLLVGATGADPAWSTNIDLPGTLDVTGATTLDDTVQIDGATTISAVLTANSVVVDNVTYNADAITSSTTLDIVAAGGLTIEDSAGPISIGATAVTQAINIGTGAAARTITMGNTSGATALVLNSGTGGVALNTTGTGDVVVTSADTVQIDGAGVVEINSTGGVIGIGNDNDAQNINVGTGAAARTITIGNITAATALAFNAGTGGIAMTSTGVGTVAITSTDLMTLDAAGVLELNSSGGVIGIGNDAVAQNINIGTGAAARTITVGNITDATALAFNAGTGGIAMTTTGVGTVALTSTDLMTLDSAGVLELNSSAGVIGIGNDAVAQNINIGTGAAARTITIGNTSGASAIDINYGSGTFAVGDASSGAIAMDTAAGISLDAATASNFTVTGASADLTLAATGGSVNITATEAAADAIVLSSSNAAGGIDLSTGGGEITISSAGNVTMVPATSSVAGTSLTINARVGVATFTGQTTAAAATLDLTITNSALGAGDGVFCTVSNKGSNDADISLEGVITETAGTLTVHCQNNGAAALNGDVIVTFWIIN